MKSVRDVEKVRKDDDGDMMGIGVDDDHHEERWQWW